MPTYCHRVASFEIQFSKSLLSAKVIFEKFNRNNVALIFDEDNELWRIIRLQELCRHFELATVIRLNHFF